MTDEQIVKALECCTLSDNLCAECPLYGEVGCVRVRNILILELVRRQQNDIEWLNGYVNSLTELCETKTALLTDANWSLITTRAEVIKEFVKRLKEHSCFYDLSNYHSFRAVDVDDIDDIAKEMLGD